MKILGQGHQSIVVSDVPGSAKKFYLSETEALREQRQLAFIADMQDEGFSIGCRIPKLLEIVGTGKWELNGKTYAYCVRLERIPGISAKQTVAGFSEQQIKTLGRDLGNIAFSLHTFARSYNDRWRRKFTKNGKELMDHLLKDKAGRVLNEEPEPDIKAKVKTAKQFLENKRAAIDAENTLSHRDLSLSNTQIDLGGRVNGLVDWGSFGLANPSLSLYELVYEPVWPYVKYQYEHMGGSINEDVACAAAVIHLAWAPIISRQLGIPLHESETLEIMEAMYEKFKMLTAH